MLYLDNSVIKFHGHCASYLRLTYWVKQSSTNTQFDQIFIKLNNDNLQINQAFAAAELGLITSCKKKYWEIYSLHYSYKLSLSLWKKLWDLQSSGHVKGSRSKGDKKAEAILALRRKQWQWYLAEISSFSKAWIFSVSELIHLLTATPF